MTDIAARHAPTASIPQRDFRRTPRTSTFRVVARTLPAPGLLLHVGPHAGAHRVALRAGLAVGMPLLVLFAIGRLDLALYTTFGAFASLYARSHPPLPRARVQLGAGAMLVGAVAVGALVALGPERTWIAVPVTAAYAGFATFLADRFGWQPAGSLFPVFALSATASLPHDLGSALLAIGLAAAAAAFAVVIGAASAVSRRRRGLPARPLTVGDRRHRSAAVTRAVLAVGVAGILPTALGLGFPYWAMVSAAASLVGMDAASRFLRAGHRLLGTLAGVGVTAVIFLFSPAPLLTVLIVCALQIGAELFVVRNYSLALVFVTPLALLMIALAHPGAPEALLLDRVVETVVGVGVVIAVTAVEHVHQVSKERRPAPR